jgi:hypothetical protein
VLSKSINESRCDFEAAFGAEAKKSVKNFKKAV